MCLTSLLVLFCFCLKWSYIYYTKNQRFLPGSLGTENHKYENTQGEGVTWTRPDTERNRSLYVVFTVTS